MLLLECQYGLSNVLLDLQKSNRINKETDFLPSTQNEITKNTDIQLEYEI
jgi:hypothetical protein